MLLLRSCLDGLVQVRTELVIFDCDGVLVDSEAWGDRVLVQFVAEFGLALQ